MTEPTERIPIQVAGLHRVWRKTSGGDVWVLVESPSSDWAAFDRAVGEANALADARGSSALGQFPALVPNGCVVCVADAESTPGLDEWLADCANSLQIQGLTGALRAAPAAPQFWILDPARRRLPTAFISWTLDFQKIAADTVPMGHWQVPAHTTEEVARAAARWVRMENATILLLQDVFTVVVNEEAVERGLTRALATSGSAGVDYVGADGKTARHISMDPPGSTLGQILGKRLSFPETMAGLRALITAVPEHLEHAFVRQARTGVLADHEMFNVVPLPGTSEPTIRNCKHLFGQFVPDAHGMQVLRDAHLERAHDLSDWHITPLGHGRHLVEAADLAPWYTGRVPVPETLEKARRDFGDMILTEAARDVPRPY